MEMDRTHQMITTHDNYHRYLQYCEMKGFEPGGDGMGKYLEVISSTGVQLSSMTEEETEQVVSDLQAFKDAERKPEKVDWNEFK